MRIRYSRRATRDLTSIQEYRTERSPQRAIRVMAAILAAVEFIRRYPGAAEMTLIAGVRAKLVRRYRFKIFFRVVQHIIQTPVAVPSCKKEGEDFIIYLSKKKKIKRKI